MCLCEFAAIGFYRPAGEVEGGSDSAGAPAVLRFPELIVSGVDYCLRDGFVNAGFYGRGLVAVMPGGSMKSFMS